MPLKENSPHLVQLFRDEEQGSESFADGVVLADPSVFTDTECNSAFFCRLSRQVLLGQCYPGHSHWPQGGEVLHRC